MRHTIQTSESIKLGVILALSGGLMDAYSYIERGQVFANAQTGNILLLGIHLSQGNFVLMFRYLFPVLAFVLGIALADIVRVKSPAYLHWRQVAVLAEALILIAVSFMPLSLNLAANSLTSFACGIQVESFRKIHGNGIATTMCIGNLRSATEHMGKYFRTRERAALRKSFLYFGIILSFVAGAVIGNRLIGIFAERAILFSSVLLFLAFAVMFIDSEKARQ